MEKDRILKSLEKLFVYFYTTVIKDPYLSNFFSSFEQLPELVESQSEYLYKALFDSGDTFRLYKKVGDIHWKLKIHEDYMFEMIEFIRKNIESLNFYGEVEIDDTELEKTFLDIKNANAKSYIEGILSETARIFSFLKSASFIIEHYYSFAKRLLASVESGDFSSVKEFLHRECAVTEWFKTPAFSVMFYTHETIVPVFQFFHKNSHDYAKLLIGYLESGDYIKALRMARLFAASSHLFVLYGIYLFSQWEKNKEKIFFSFLTDPKFAEKIVSFIVTPSSKKDFTDPIFREFSKALIDHVNEHYSKDIFGFELSGRIYFVSRIEEEIRDLSNLKRAIDEVKRELKDRQDIEKTLSFKLVQVNVKSVRDRFKFDPHKLSLFFELAANRFLDEKGTYFVVNHRHIEEIWKEVNEIVRYECLVDRLILAKRDESCEGYFTSDVGFEMYAQRIVDITTGEDFGAECLLRIKTNDELIPAKKFVDFVKDKNLTKELDLKVLDLVSREIKRIKKVKKVFVNLFPSSYTDLAILRKIKRLGEISKDVGVDVVFEITEYESTKNKNILSIIDSLDVDIALDDFGSGYTNFERVASLSSKENVRFLKIDGEIVKNILSNRYFKDVVEIITYMANRLSKDIIYEFVENNEIAEILKDIAKNLGVKALAQGYYFAKPEPIENLF